MLRNAILCLSGVETLGGVTSDGERLLVAEGSVPDIRAALARIRAQRIPFVHLEYSLDVLGQAYSLRSRRTRP